MATHKKRMARREDLRGTLGSQLLEFALVLPLLLALAIGVTDFGKAYNLKHIVTNAAREGARITASNSVSNMNCSPNPCGIYAAADAVKQYMLNAGLSAASCITPSSPSSSGTLTWTYSCNGITLTIDRSIALAGGPGGSVIPSTQVTLSYPYTWTFNNVIGLLVPGSTVTLPSTLSTSAIMANLIN